MKRKQETQSIEQKLELPGKHVITKDMEMQDNKIYALKDSTGEIKTDTVDIIKIVEEFYKNLYKQEETNIDLQQDIIGKIGNKLTEEDRMALSNRITSQDKGEYKAIKKKQWE